jgi:hypothetical protein
VDKITFDAYGGSHIETPTPEQTAEHLKVLLATNLPHQYRAAVERQERAARERTPRPSLKTQTWATETGIVYGLTLAVQSLFGYFFNSHAEELLKASVVEIDKQKALKCDICHQPVRTATGLHHGGYRHDNDETDAQAQWCETAHGFLRVKVNGETGIERVRV